MLKRLSSSTFSTRSLAILAGLAALSIGAAYVFLLKASEQKPAEKVATQSASAMQRTKVVALGRLEPEDEIIRVAGPTGAEIRDLKVAEGELVQPGQVLAYLNSYQEMLAKRNLAASQVAEIQGRIKTDNLVNQAEIDQARSQMGPVGTPKLQEMRSQEAAVRKSEAELQQATVMRDRYERLHREGAVSQEDRDIRRLLVVQTQENLNQTRAKLDQLTAARDADLQVTQENLKLSQVKSKQVKSQSGLESAMQNLELAKAQLEQTIIRATKRGQVLKIYTHAGEAIGNSGILELGNTQQMSAVAEVYETDVGRVKVGQRATISSPALPEKITGIVAQVGRLVFKNNIIGDDPAALSDARVVEVKIRLDNSQLVAGLSNLQVDVQIDIK